MEEIRQSDKATARFAPVDRAVNSGIDEPKAKVAPLGRLEYRPGTLYVAVLTGGGDRPYALGLAATLISQGVAFDFIASEELDDPELHRSPLVRFFNFRQEMRSNVPPV